ncbi:MAG TPA: thioesterase family protein [Candidatus Methylacidiphilales bacterium]|nr:thioesterase family protein [Candidatus Methylacidiphilales bacterium]
MSVTPLPAQPRIRVPLEVYYFDTDAGGVVHNIAYLRMIEIARTQLAASLGWSVEEMNRTGLVPVVVRTEIDYLKPARLGDHLTVMAELMRLEKIRFFIRFEISVSGGEPVFVRCTQTMVTVQLPGGRPQRIPPAWRDAYPQLMANS